MCLYKFLFVGQHWVKRIEPWKQDHVCLNADYCVYYAVIIWADLLSVLEFSFLPVKILNALFLLHAQGLTKVVSDSPGLLDVPFGQADLSSRLPNGQAWLQFVMACSTIDWTLG